MKKKQISCVRGAGPPHPTPPLPLTSRGREGKEREGKGRRRRRKSKKKNQVDLFLVTTGDTKTVFANNMYIESCTHQLNTINLIRMEKVDEQQTKFYGMLMSAAKRSDNKD